MLKKIEELTPEEVDKLVGSLVLKLNTYQPVQYSQNWAAGGPIIERYLIGSEGKSAWVWHNGRNYGIEGSSQLDACMRALLLSRFPSGEIETGP